MKVEIEIDTPNNMFTKETDSGKWARSHAPSMQGVSGCYGYVNGALKNRRQKYRNEHGNLPSPLEEDVYLPEDLGQVAFVEGMKYAYRVLNGLRTAELLHGPNGYYDADIPIGGSEPL